ncbi:hypothetical protein BC831DRAFT_508411 [Entophlyctis helioformis]|nr:hypothetical protein BC831DRAFT_508411 [Entophlyctis helioformis]
MARPTQQPVHPAPPAATDQPPRFIRKHDTGGRQGRKGRPAALVEITDGPHKGVICVQPSRLPLVLKSFVPSRLNNNVPAFAIKANLGGREVWVVPLDSINKLRGRLWRLQDRSNPGIVMHGDVSRITSAFKDSVYQLLDHYAKYRDHHEVSLITHDTQ